MRRAVEHIALLLAVLLLVVDAGWVPAVVRPEPSPLSVDGLTVVVIRESYDVLPHPQKLAIDALPFIAAEVGARFSVLDPDQDVSRGHAWEREALGRSRGALPWLIAANGTTGVERPLPDAAGLRSVMEGLK